MATRLQRSELSNFVIIVCALADAGADCHRRGRFRPAEIAPPGHSRGRAFVDAVAASRETERRYGAGGEEMATSSLH